VTAPDCEGNAVINTVFAHSGDIASAHSTNNITIGGHVHFLNAFNLLKVTLNTTVSLPSIITVVFPGICAQFLGMNAVMIMHSWKYFVQIQWGK
jgi:hypothetical protein